MGTFLGETQQRPLSYCAAGVNGNISDASGRAVVVVAVVTGGDNGGAGAAPQIIPPHSHLFNHQQKSPHCCDPPH